MLASIHPLGERARRQRWGITATSYVVGSVAGGATAGALAGGLGALLGLGGAAAAATAAGACVAAVVLDLRRPSLPVPTIRRQVNERWLTSFRGWVYGFGFGYQLGLGVVTIVTTALVYASLVLSLATGSPGRGALVGASFGLGRALPILAVRQVHDAPALRALHVRFQGLEAGGRRASLVVAAAAAALFVGTWALSAPELG